MADPQIVARGQQQENLMSSKIRFPLIALDVDRLSFLLPLFALFHCGHALGACDPMHPKYQDIDIQCPGGNGPAAIYDNPGGTPITDLISLCPPTCYDHYCELDICSGCRWEPRRTLY